MWLQLEETGRKTMMNKQSNPAAWELVPRQQEVFLELMSTTLNTYMDFLRIPFSFFQTEVNATEAATRQATQLAEHVIQQANEAATQQVKQLIEQATQQAMEAATQQVKQLAEQAELQATEVPEEQVKQLAEQQTQQAMEAATQQIKQFIEQTIQEAMEAATQRVKQLAEQAALQVAEAAGSAAQLHRQHAQLWTFESPVREAESYRPLLLEVHGPGIAHAGVNQDGKWIRTYDVPLEEVSPGVWHAYLMDPEINEFTFIWYDPDQPGKVHWEGKNYDVSRQEKRAEEVM